MSEPKAQLPMSFARPERSKGGLPIREYRALVDRLRVDAAHVAQHFALPRYTLDAERADATDLYGVCYEDGTIRVRLVHARTGKPLRYSALIDTVVHELAHLEHMNHGPLWEQRYEEMLAWCRKEGIYAPQVRAVSIPKELPSPRSVSTQLGLF